jgi:hypothetical protein
MRGRPVDSKKDGERNPQGAKKSTEKEDFAGRNVVDMNGVFL